MASTATLIEYTEEPDGSVQVTFDDGSGIHFTSKDALRGWVSALHTDGDVVKKLLLAWWSARSPDLSNWNLVNGKTLTFDLSSPNPIKVQ